MFERCSVQETVSRLESDARRGLTAAEAGRRLAVYGRNEMKEPRKKTAVELFLEQLNDPLIYVLIVAAAVSILLREISDAAIIGVVVALNALIGLLQEGKAKRALASLQRLTSPRAAVIRDGKRLEIPAAQLVRGDLVCLEAGCRVPADMRLVQSVNLKIEESALTGEAVPAEKDSGFMPAGGRGCVNSDFAGNLCRRGVPEDTPLEELPFKEVPIGDRRNMAYMSTIVTYGRGTGIVTATGMDTELGKIAGMITQSKEEQTPLQRRLGDLGKVLSLLSLLLCGALFAIAVLQKRDVPAMLITAISLAVAAVPEGLPAVVTICLALSVTRMVRVNTIVRRLPSVETLGAVSVVCSDKTGTLTQNRMTVEKCFVRGRILEASEIRLSEEYDFLLGMTLCSDAETGEGGGMRGTGKSDDRTPVSGIVNGGMFGTGKSDGRSCVSETADDGMCAVRQADDRTSAFGEQSGRMGDPTELALLDFAAMAGLTKAKAQAGHPRTGEIPFDSDRKMMSTLHGSVSYTKGAPDEVLKRCTHILTADGVARLSGKERRQVQDAMAAMSGEALRTLAVAMRRGVPDLQESGLIFLGMAGMRDPARPEAARAAADFREAGVTTVMITGDHAETAFAIAKQLGIAEHFGQCMAGEELACLTDEQLEKRLEDTKVFARVSPAQKVRIVKGFQSRGEIVAMTGDGVNDAPSLKKADIGIAMGRSGTDVARQAADMVLTDDNFATIRRAIEEGRGVYENIRKSVIFLLSSNLGELITMFLAVVCGLAAPLKSSHILWINLITDSLPALALGVDQNDGKSLMRQSPRKASESLFARGGLVCTCFYGALIAAVSLSAFLMLPVALLHNRGISLSIPALAGILREEWVLSKAQTYAFTVLGMSQLTYAVGMRDAQRSVFRMNHLENKLMIAACAIGFLLQFAVTEVPFLISAFGTSPLSGREWMRLSLLSAAPLLAHEIMCLAALLPGGRRRAV